MKKFKNGDKVKIPTIGTACIRTSLEEIQESLADYKLDYLYVCDVWEDDEIGLMRGDGKVLEQDLYHERDLEHYEKYNETFNPEAHSSLIIDFDKHESLLIEAIENNKVETIEEASIKEIPELKHIINDVTTVRNIAIKLAKSDAARNHWFKIFQEKQKTIEQLFAELGVFEKVKVMRQLKKYV